MSVASATPPPSPNKLVRVRLQDNPQNQSLYVPVQVSGLLRVEKSEATLFILDGESRMVSGWTLDANTVDRREDLGGNGVVGASDNTVATGAER